jgi:hypothetical protein
MIDAVVAEDGVVLGGAKASGRLRDGGPADVYVAADVLNEIVARYAPDVHSNQPNVIARVVWAPWPFAPGERVVWPQVAALDLLERGNDARARAVARELFGNV